MRSATTDDATLLYCVGIESFYLTVMPLEQILTHNAAYLALAVLVLLALLLVVAVTLAMKWRALEQREADAQASIRRLHDDVRAHVSQEMSGVRQEMNSIVHRQLSEQNAQFVNFLGLIQQMSTDQTHQLGQLRDVMANQLHTVHATVGNELDKIRQQNDKALADIQSTVQDKLQTTINDRLSLSFKTVEDQLAAVHRGLGEMREMAQDVDGLRRVLTNVKTRGTFGEVQLGYLLDELLTVEQYAKNVATRPGSDMRVEFAVRLPGNGTVEQIWLPIDAKFPLEDYERLIDARERADKEGETASLKALATRIVDEATKIRAKYVEVPYTTEFAVLYLPIESLWADVLKIPGLMERVQRETHVTIAGPTVLAALINSLQMGFRTLAIEQKSAEVWHVLGQVKTEFVKFAQAIEGVEKKMDGVRTAIGAVKTRTNVMNRRLQSVEAVRSETVVEQENSLDCS